ncbi:MAG: hypothetical protein PHG20_05835 [Geobacteraceae bacterium]|nr:hypothetical protein [Geobacteraceae bacterium]
MKPTLSAEGRYVTMLSQSNVIYGGKLNLFDLETGELVHLEQPGNASWAVYNPELDKFFYSNPYGTLYSIKPDSTDLVTHFAGFSVEANTSRTMDNRFIAIWKASKDELNTCFVYDCLTGSSFSLDNTGFIALNPVKPELTYVRFDGEKAKLIRRHLETGDEIMIHDAHNKGGGYISGYSSFNYRMDGEKLRFVVYIMTKAAVGPYD